MRSLWTLVIALAVLGGAFGVVEGAQEESPYAGWENGPPSDPEFFPIGVWLQNPANAAAYKEAGINFYVGLWQGPTDAQLGVLKQHGMPVLAAQNDVGLQHLEDPIIIGWTQPDEPDNAQPLPEGGYGPPVDPQVVIDRYEEMKAADPTRPVFLNLGQGVANDDWVGRGPDAQLSDYVEYCKGADIVSFDVYPVAGIRKPDGENYLWYVAKGLDRLHEWCDDSKIIWNILETTNISSENQVTPHQLRAEVWMSLIHGSKGIVYFVHKFEPYFDETALLNDPEMLAAVTGINNQIHSLAPVLNSPSIDGRVSVTSTEEDVPVDIMVKEQDGMLYIFAVGMRNASTGARFEVDGLPDEAAVEAIGEDRTIQAVEGVFTDEFEAYDVHLYKLKIE